MGSVSYIRDLYDNFHRHNWIRNDHSSPAILRRDLPSRTRRAGCSCSLIFYDAVYFLSHSRKIFRQCWKETRSTAINPDLQRKLHPLCTGKFVSYAASLEDNRWDGYGISSSPGLHSRHNQRKGKG